ncbi:cupin domain-containing protein [Cupriavidus campinensis]
MSRLKLGVGGVLITIAMLGLGQSTAQTPAPRKFSLKTLQEIPLGELPPGKWNMAASMLVIEPGGEIPFHVHKGPGLRYVLEGAITIIWKEGKTRTFEAGSTYFEGKGENHPAGTISAKNAGKVPCRVVIVELTPQE